MGARRKMTGLSKIRAVGKILTRIKMYELGALPGKQDESSVSYSVPLQAALLTFSNCVKVDPGVLEKRG